VKEEGWRPAKAPAGLVDRHKHGIESRQLHNTILATCHPDRPRVRITQSMLSHNCVYVSAFVSHLKAQFHSQLVTCLTVDLFSHYNSFIVIGADGVVNVFY
jgi:uncharacterized pyridoxamine 5'-phosphate oxidase family protein